MEALPIRLLESAASLGSLIRFVVEEDALAVTGATPSEFDGSIGSVFVDRSNGYPVIRVGLGARAAVSENAVRRAAGAAARRALKLGLTELAIDLSGVPQWASAVVEGAIMGGYTFDRFKSSGRREYSLASLSLIAPGQLHPQIKDEAARGELVARASNLVREIGNTPPNILTPAALAEEAKRHLEASGYSVSVLDKKCLEQERFGGLLAVGGGSRNEPRFICAERRVGEQYPTIAIVGKAITFDSGGLSIKPRQAMDEMKYDKMGGVAVIGILQAIAELDLPVNVVGAICSAENLTGEGAYRPSDIVTIYGGKTVEVLDTDAEGRIVLADGLSYVGQHFDADLTIDLATLTGACCVALGLGRSGVFSPDASLAEALVQAGERTGDACWALPLGSEYADGLKSRIADIRNIANTRWGGASIAAEFLRHFVGEKRWVHLDIAGPALLLEDRPEMEPGATAAGVRVVIEMIRERYGRSKQDSQPK